jgi:aryl-alcohol dehydrogenase
LPQTDATTRRLASGIGNRVAVTQADGPWAIESARLRAPLDDEVLIRTVAAGICHTDVVIRERAEQPTVLGHEGAGIVIAVGAAVADIHPGDHVVASFAWCGHCENCQHGLPAYCQHFAALNVPRSADSPLSRPDGTPLAAGFFGQSSFGTYFVTGARHVVVLPSGTDLTLAAPLACGLLTGAGAVLNVLLPQAGSLLAVFGCGAVGLSAIMAATALGVRTIAVDPISARRDLAIELGAIAAIDPNQAHPTSGVRALGGGAGAGAHYAIDTTGLPDVARQALETVTSLGRVVVVGSGVPEAAIDVRGLIAGGKTLRGCTEGDAVPRQLIPRLLEMHRSGTFDIHRLVRRYAFDDIASAIADATSGRVVKPVLIFPEEA